MPNEQKEAQPRPASSSDIAPELEALVAELERGTRAGTQPRPHELIQAIRTLGFDIVPRQPVSGGGFGGLAAAIANGEELLATGEALLAFDALGSGLER